jgi:hypothetical protein
MTLNQKMKYLMNIICFCSNDIQFLVNRRRNTKYRQRAHTVNTDASGRKYIIGTPARVRPARRVVSMNRGGKTETD